MKNKLSQLLCLAASQICIGSVTHAQSGYNIHIGANGIDVQPQAFVSYYQAPPDRVVWLQREQIPETQWPLLFELARAGKVTPERVWQLRGERSSWYDVLSFLNVPASYFYYDVPPTQRLPYPYNRAYGYYRTNPNQVVRWSDSELVRLASVKNIHDRTHRPTHEAIELYQDHPNFIQRGKRSFVGQMKRNNGYRKAPQPKKARQNDNHKNDNRGHSRK